MGAMSQGFNGYGTRGQTQGLTDSLTQGYNQVSAGQSNVDPMSMAGGFQSNSDQMGIVKSSDVAGKGIMSAMAGGLGKALTGAFDGTKGKSYEWGTFSPQQTLNYSMEQSNPMTMGGDNQMYQAMKQYANSLPTKMQYPSYHGGR